MNKKQMEKYLKDSIHYIFNPQPKKKKTGTGRRTTKKKTFAQQVGIPEPDHEHGYTTLRIASFMTKEELKSFSNWMYGQTCAWDEKLKECIYYSHDVERFIASVRKNIPTYWD